MARLSLGPALYLFRAPRHFLAHCWRRLNRRNILQRSIAKAHKTDEAADELTEQFALEDERPDKDVDCDRDMVLASSHAAFCSGEIQLTHSTTEEGEEERGISRELWWNVGCQFKSGHNCSYRVLYQLLSLWVVSILFGFITHQVRIGLGRRPRYRST